MGHFYTVVRGDGKSRQEALGNAIDLFLSENGNRHDVRGVSKYRLLKRVPPLDVGRAASTGTAASSYSLRDENMPQSQWNEVW